MKKNNKLKITGLIIILAVSVIGLCLGIKTIVFKPRFSSSAKTHHLVVISIDALNAKDYDEMKDLPNFKQLMSSGSYAKEVVGVYPSLTYPSHTSIITGVYPDKHGIYANELNEPGVKEQHWHWQASEVKVPTLYGIAKKSNMKVGIMFWPVTAGAKVDYNFPEIWAVGKEKNQVMLTLKNGTIPFIAKCELKYGKERNGTKQPQLDNYITDCISDLIRTKKPNLTLVHLSELDHNRHKHGLMSNEAKDALKRMDSRVGKIVQSAKDAGIYNDTTFIVLGDHGFLDGDYKICLNTEFRKEGLITVDDKGKLTDWKAYMNYCDGSAQIYLKNPNDKETLEKVGQILNRLRNDPSSGIEAVYTKEQAAKKRVSGDFVYMLEAKKGYFFANDWTGNLIVKIDKNNIIDDDEYSYLATHGYDPLKPNYRTFFMASGAGIKKGVVLDSINIVDEGPTMANLLGLSMPNCDGRVLNEMIER